MTNDHHQWYCWLCKHEQRDHYADGCDKCVCVRSWLDLELEHVGLYVYKEPKEPPCSS